MTKPTHDPELATKALNLRRGGLSFDVIADQLGVTANAAKTLVEQALSAHDPDFQRNLETDRLDRLHASLWPRAVKGELDAVDRVLRISERREKVSAVPKVNEHALRNAFDESAKTSADVNPGWDAALIEAGRKIADRVDEAVATGEGQELTKALYLIPHLNNVLREMLATPASRRNAADATPPAPRDGKLAQLRAIQGARKSG